MNKIVFSLLISVFVIISTKVAFAQYKMENLDRGVVAVHQGSYNLVSWRYLGTDPESIAFNIYRDGTRLNNQPITDRTNFRDNGASASAQYVIKPVVNGQEQAASKTALTWGDQFLEIPLNRPAGGSNEDGNFEYSPNDASVADLDGDGEYEIIIKWDPSNAKDNSQQGYTGNVYLEALKLDGTSLWRIDLGRNIRAGAHYTQFIVYDFDGNGRAELACKTAPGTRDGKGDFLSNGPAATDDDNADYRTGGSWRGFIIEGPEYLTVFDGESGAEVNTVNFVPDRYPTNGWGKSSDNTNRVDRFISGVAYLDGQNPSLIMGRGYYGRMAISAWDFNNNQLKQRWVFDTNEDGYGHYAGKGNHQLSIADVDEDGRQEVVYGAVTINDDGSGLYASSWGHGDALHVSDFDLDNPGLEIFMPVEYATPNPADGRPGVAMKDAATGEVLWAKYPSEQTDVGRGICANIDERYSGAECWGSSGFGLYDSKGNHIGNMPSSANFAVWWDGDLTREILDGDKLDDWNNGQQSREYTIYDDNAAKINGSKSNPSLQADFLGDWREELIFPHWDNTKLLVFTTNFETSYRVPVLMHDPQYRTAIAWQNSGYNQPPHPSFFLGEGEELPEQPEIAVVGGEDCNGVSGGNAFLDECGTCVGGNTGLEPCVVDCNGDPNGTAGIDDCGVCSGGNTGLEPCASTMEAENACSVVGILSENINPGYSGEGYVNTDNVFGSSVSWTINSDASKTATLTFRFANGGSGARDGELFVNGNSVGQIDLPVTGAWETWDLVSVNVPLSEGSNDLVLEATAADGLANLDLIHLSSGVSDAQCVITSTINKTSLNNLKVFPNPTRDELKWNLESEWTLFNSQGQELDRGKGKQADLAGYPNGLYFIKLGEKVVKVVKE